jgi:hypothetical protein
MKAYLVTTSTIFGLLVVAHIWRMFAESGNSTRDPWFLGITVFAAAMCFWSVRLLMRTPRA